MAPGNGDFIVQVLSPRDGPGGGGNKNNITRATKPINRISSKQ